MLFPVYIYICTFGLDEHTHVNKPKNQRKKGAPKKGLYINKTKGHLSVFVS